MPFSEHLRRRYVRATWLFACLAMCDLAVVGCAAAPVRPAQCTGTHLMRGANGQCVPCGATGQPCCPDEDPNTGPPFADYCTDPGTDCLATDPPSPFGDRNVRGVRSRRRAGVHIGMRQRFPCESWRRRRAVLLLCGACRHGRVAGLSWRWRVDDAVAVASFLRGARYPSRRSERPPGGHVGAEPSRARIAGKSAEMLAFGPRATQWHVRCKLTSP